MTDVKKLWSKYDAVLAYNSSFGKGDYFEKIKVHYDFYNGDQWIGINAKSNLPQMQFNIIKRTVDFKVASLTSSNISVNIEPLEYSGAEYDEKGNQIISKTDLINAETRNIFEKIALENLIKRVLKDGAVTGDMCFHNIFNPNKKPYRGIAPLVKGEIEVEILDSTNVGFGNTNIKDPQKQPWIIVIGRDTVKNLKKEAEEKNTNEIEIQSDNETGYQVSDVFNSEIEIQGDDEGKALYIYIYEKKTVTLKDENKQEYKEEHVFVTKCTKDTIIYENIDLETSRYPIAFDNWYEQKGTYHGRGEVEGIEPNQIAINKMFAMIVYHLMMTAFPPALYDADVISNWNNKVGTAFGIKGLKGRALREVATYLEPANMSDYIVKTIDLAIQYTKDCLGVSDASLGQIDPKNTSAIIAVQKAAAVPLENIKDNLYNLIEQLVLNIIDMISAKYGTRPVVVTNPDGTRQIVQFNFDELKNMDLKTSIDIGESSYYSAIAVEQTLDNLLTNGFIEFIDYLERMPDERIPKKAELINKLKDAQAEAQTQAQYEEMAVFLESLPPEQQQQILSLPPEQQEQAILELMKREKVA